MTPNISQSEYTIEENKGREYVTILGTEVYSVSNRIKLERQDTETGEMVENDYFVLESKIFNVGNELKCEYTLGKETDYFVDPIPNKEIKGAIIEARVVHIARTDESQSNHGRTDGSSDNLEGRPMGAKPINVYVGMEQEKNEDRSEEVRASDIAVMTLDLTEGLRKLGGSIQSESDKYAGKSYFPYVTPYSQTNTGFSPAPEPNDRVALNFPSETETHAIVIGAVNNNGNGRFTNPDKRNFTLGPSQAAKDGTPANEGKPMYNFTLDSEKFIINVGNTISMTSGGTVGITGTEEVKMASSESSVGISANKDIDISATNGKAEMKAKTYATVRAEQNAELAGGDNTNVGFGSEMLSNKTHIKGEELIAESLEEGTFGSAGAHVTVIGSDVKING